MTEFSFTVLGDPISKGRPRVVHGGQGFTPKRTRDAETLVRNTFKLAYPDATPIAGPVRILVHCYMATRRNKDLDNMVKLVTDALNRVAYIDDGQITVIDARKIEPTPGNPKETPRTEVLIESLPTKGVGE